MEISEFLHDATFSPRLRLFSPWCGKLRKNVVSLLGMNTNHPRGLEELKTLRTPVRNVNIEHTERLTRLEKFALRITNRVGTMGFFLAIFCWTVLWWGWNAFAPRPLRFDPFPAFVLWLLISNMIQIFLMPLIMVRQNLQSRHSEVLAENEYEVNMKAEREIETILMRLQEQNALIRKMASGSEQGPGQS